MKINLLNGKENEIEVFLQSQSDDVLEKLKKGNILGIKDFVTKGLDEGLIEEHEMMKELIKKEINRRNQLKSSKK